MQKIIVAPDSFKGSLSAIEVAAAMEAGIRQVFTEATVCQLPIADGGEGTVAAMVAATGGEIRRTKVTGPLGEPIYAAWGILGDGMTAVIEMAAASGLTLVPQGERNPALTTTFGTGELIRAALDAGLRKVVIGIGGSATNDGGAGMLQALGMRFTDAAGRELPPGGLALAHLAQVDNRGLDCRLAETEFKVACDVDNPLCGARGAAAVFGPQKGATPELVARLDAALRHYAERVHAATGRDIASVPGSGAAGGLGGGLLLLPQVQLLPGIDLVLDAVRFAELVQGSDLVITGEGRTDIQTTYGKAPVGVAKIAQAHGVPVVCLSGGLGEGHQAVEDCGIQAVMSIVDKPMALEACMQDGAALLTAATARLCKLIRIGQTAR